MHYYEVYVADSSYKRPEPLTYGAVEELATGQLVRAPLKRRDVLGLIGKPVGRPAFTVKPVTAVPDISPLPAHLLELARWMTVYYAAGLGEVMQHMLPAKLPAKLHIPAMPAAAGRDVALPPLTDEQSAALQAIDAPQTYVLHGDTGSGKSRVYLELAQRTLDSGRSSLILTPEIGLTPQLAAPFQAVFGLDTVLVTHSQLTDKDRRELWLRMLLSDRPLIVIGPRSALFAPLKDIGLIVLDESHDGSYKQEQTPYYHATAVAGRLGALHKAPLILGSGTPALNDIHMARLKQRPVLRMQALARGHTDFTQSITTVDLKQRDLFSRQPNLSDPLLQAISASLSRHEQSLVYLNRRGTARTILCESCGWQAVCPNCDLPLTYHGDRHQARCHTCGLVQPARSDCPDCGSVRIQLRAVGTKALVTELERAFPEATIRRFDKDNTKEERLEAHYEAVRSGDIDILVGTQLITKGLDLPRLSTVGVAVADTSLYFPDYTAQERTYQLLRQVIGRVGRGHRDASVIVQTYDPENPTLLAALANDWDGFAEAELREREAFMFPPFCFVLKLSCRRATTTSAEKAATQLAAQLRASHGRIVVEGPAPSFHEKMAGKYQWQIIVKAKDRRELLQVVHALPSNWTADIDPGNLL